MTTTSLTIILIAYAVLIAFFVYMEIKLKDRDSHFEIVEIVPLDIDGDVLFVSL